MDVFKDHERNDVFLLSPHDATPVMIQPDREAVTDNLLLQPEVAEWLEQTPGAYRLWETPDFIEITFTDAVAATAFKVRWYGSYPHVVIYAGIPQSEHSAIDRWNQRSRVMDELATLGKSAVISLIDDSYTSALQAMDVYGGDEIKIVRDTALYEHSLMKLEFIFDHPKRTDKDFFRSFEKRRPDGSFQKGRRR